MERYGIGVDLGGTKILAGVVELETGTVVSSAKKRTVPTPKDNKEKDGKDKEKENDLAKRIGDAIDEALAVAKLPSNTRFSGIGVGAAGQVDRSEKILVFAPNLGVKPNYALGQLLGERFNLPVSLGNDVEAATIGELHFGAGKGCADFVCIFTGTGIGSGIVQNGQLRRGATGTAGEVGHMVVAAEGRLCGCGGRGHLEAYASRTAITRTLLGELKRGRKSVLTELLEGASMPDPTSASSVAIRSKVIAKAIEADDELVKHVVREAAEFLGLGLASVINFYNPERIILGGGLMEAVDYLFNITVREAKWEALRLPASQIEITRTGLGDFSGLIGAALLTTR
ncbi:MAG TPA: ROK family protein [Chloroflexia bacterium]|nr:ROK family protein [Chloroflexia bacterium]